MATGKVDTGMNPNGPLARRQCHLFQRLLDAFARPDIDHQRRLGRRRLDHDRQRSCRRPDQHQRKTGTEQCHRRDQDEGLAFHLEEH